MFSVHITFDLFSVKKNKKKNGKICVCRKFVIENFPHDRPPFLFKHSCSIQPRFLQLFISTTKRGVI